MGLTDEEFRILQRNQEIARALDNPQPVIAPAVDNPPEALIQEECEKFMEEDSWRVLRTEPVSNRSRRKGFGELGMADSLFIRYRAGTVYNPNTREAEAWMRRILGPAFVAAGCQLVWIEWKAGNGKPKKHQLEWHTKERARGALTWIASVDFPASVEGFREFYAASGLMRRARWW